MVCVCVCVRHVYMMNACQSQMLEKERAEKETISLCAAFIKRAKKKRDFCSEMCARGYFCVHARNMCICMYILCMYLCCRCVFVRVHSRGDRQVGS